MKKVFIIIPTLIITKKKFLVLILFVYLNDYYILNYKKIRN